MHDRRPDDFYDPWDDNGPVEGTVLREHSAATHHLLSALIQGVRGVVRTLPIKRLRRSRC